jgi:hypothetical protein
MEVFTDNMLTEVKLEDESEFKPYIASDELVQGNGNSSTLFSCIVSRDAPDTYPAGRIIRLFLYPIRYPAGYWI